MNTHAPSSMITSIAASIVLGQRGEQVDAERLVGQLADAAHLVADAAPGGSAAMPSVPKPPASETAAHTSA